MNNNQTIKPHQIWTDASINLEGCNFEMFKSVHRHDFKTLVWPLLHSWSFYAIVQSKNTLITWNLSETLIGTFLHTCSSQPVCLGVCGIITLVQSSLNCCSCKYLEFRLNMMCTIPGLTNSVLFCREKKHCQFQVWILNHLPCSIHEILPQLDLFYVFSHT